MAHRYFTNFIEPNEKVAYLRGGDAFHLGKVLRAKIGDKIILCDGENRDYEVEIVTIAPDEIVFKILQELPCLAEPSVIVDVYIGYAKGERMDFAVQKAVELGAHAIYPFFSANTVVKPAKSEKAEIAKTERLCRIALEAAKQSGRGIIPNVFSPIVYTSVLQQAVKNDIALLLYEGGGKALSTVIEGKKNIAVITGAEGGFTLQEVEQAAQAGCTAIGLGKRILRCETAPMATLAAIMALTGNLQ